MLNQFNQFVRIQIRNVSDIATGCPIDGLINMIGVSSRYHALLEQDYGSTSRHYLVLTVGDRLTEWIERLHRKWHWHARLNCLHLHLYLQQS